MSAIEHLPPASDVADFPIDELGLRLLRYLLDTNGTGLGRLNQQSLLMTGGELQWSARNPGQGRTCPSDHERSLGLAGSQGVVPRHPDQQVEWHSITRRGAALARDPDGLARLHAEQRISVDLHPRLRKRIPRQFL